MRLNCGDFEILLDCSAMNGIKNIIVLGVFFYECGKLFTHLFKSHVDQVQWITAIL